MKLSIRILQLNFLFYLFIVLLVLSGTFYCAHKVAPKGGPEDKTPPEIIAWFPPSDSVGIKYLPYIEFEFSENIRKTTVTNNFWMIPEASGEIEVKWKGGKMVRFLFKDSLEINQTYVFTLGTEVKDMHNNGLTSPFQIAFSTGSELDRGAITGRVYSSQAARGVYIYAYLLSPELHQDSLLFEKPRYYTQIDDRGFYHLNYLAWNKYRLIALFDEDYNEIYTMETDQIGLPFNDIELDSLSPEFSNLNFYLITEDTTGPRILDASMDNNREVIVEFGEDIRLDSALRVEIVDTLTGNKIPVLGTSYSVDTPAEITIYVSPLQEELDLEISLSGFSDLEGNRPSDIPDKENFTASTETDTTRPNFIRMTPNHRSTNIPLDAHLELGFNSPVFIDSFIRCFKFRDSSGIEIQGRLNFSNLQKPMFEPDSLLTDDMKYQIELKLTGLQDIWQRPFPDTTLTLNFTTIAMAELGEISGFVQAPTLDWQRALLEIRPLRGKEEYAGIAFKKKEYIIHFLPDGRYLMTAVLDLNADGKWNMGQTFPWTFSEPFQIKSDTVVVRKRWTTRDINFEFRFRGQDEE